MMSQMYTSPSKRLRIESEVCRGGELWKTGLSIAKPTLLTLQSPETYSASAAFRFRTRFAFKPSQPMNIATSVIASSNQRRLKRNQWRLGLGVIASFYSGLRN